MFEFVRRHNKLFQLLLFLFVFPSFVLFGVQGYDRLSGDSNLAAKVDGTPITLQELDAAQRNEVARLQQALGSSVDVKTLDTPAMRMRTLDGLIRQRLLQIAAVKQHLSVSDAQVQQAILQIPQVAALRRADGSFDVQAYNQLLSAQGLSAPQFEAGVREQLLEQQLTSLGDDLIDSRAAASRLVDWQKQTRVVRVASFPAQRYAAGVNPTDAEVQAWYKAHLAQFQTPQRADIEYVVLDLPTVAQGITVTPAQARAYYDQHASQFGVAGERRASHILITVPAGATPAQDQAAKARAEQILAEVRKDPARFAEIAKAQSQDPGSAAQGGDLGWFTRDAMVGPFADAVFAQDKTGTIIGPVKSQYGYHVIELTGIKAGSAKPFAEVEPSIVSQLQTQQAQAAFADLAEKFSNKVYEDSRSFAAVAAAQHLTVRTAQGVTPTPHAGDAKTDPLANPKFLQALFADSSVRDRRNIAAVELSSHALASARIVNYQPAGTIPFAQARDQARAALVLERAGQLAARDGAQALDAARTGKAQPAWGASLDLTQQGKDGVPPQLVSAVFAADTTKLPAYVGVDVPGQGYELAAIDAVHAAAADPTLTSQLQDRFAQMQGRAATDALIESLKTKYKVEILYKPQPNSGG